MADETVQNTNNGVEENNVIFGLESLSTGLILDDDVRHLDNCQETESVDHSSAVKYSDELMAAIVNQVEYYFSSENLVKDKFLMQHIGRDTYGYVALHLIASFNRMKKLTSEVRIISCALRGSKVLEIDQSGTKVRRISPPLLHKENVSLSRTVVAVNVLDTTLDTVKLVFGAYGSIVDVQVINKGDNVPVEVRKYLGREINDLGEADTVLTLIEYESHESARLACEQLTDASDWRYGLHAYMLVADKKVYSKHVAETTFDGETKQEVSIENKPLNLEKQDMSTQHLSRVAVRKKRKNKRRFRVSELAQGMLHIHSSSGSESESQESKEHQVNTRHKSNSVGRNGFNASDSRGLSSELSPSNSANLGRHIELHGRSQLVDDALSGELRARSGSTGAINCSSHSSSPWVQRRLKAAEVKTRSIGMSTLTYLTAIDADHIPKKKSDLVIVLRPPKGPDGTRGFAAC